MKDKPFFFRKGRIGPVAAALLALGLVAACSGEQARQAPVTASSSDTLPAQPVLASPDLPASEPAAPSTTATESKPRDSAARSTDDEIVSGAVTGGARDALSEPEFYLGSAVFHRPARSRGKGVVIAEGGRVSLSFIDADLIEVVDATLGDILEVNYAIDPGVQGMVTFRTSSPMARANLLPALENLLAANGAALVLDNDVLYVVPLEVAGRLPGVVVTPERRSRAQGRAVHIFPLSFVSAGSLLDVLRGQVGPGQELVADELRNMLIFVGSSEAARALGDMVGVLDVDVLNGMSFALFPVEVAPVEDLARDLEVVFQQESPALQGVLQLLPIERLSAILAVSPQPAYLRQVGVWVERLDRADAGAGRRIFVYYVKNGRAVDLADILNQVFVSGGSDGASSGGAAVAPGLVPVQIGEVTESAEAADDGGVGITRRVGAGDIAAATGVGISIGGISSDSGDIRVIADERNNALVILATTSEYQQIEATLNRLDILPLQVLIEATIAEVTLNDQLKYGLQWFFSSGNFETSLSTFGSGAVSQIFPGFNFLFDTSDARVVLSALSDITDVNVVSSPQLMVLDNQSARLQVGDQVPIATQSAVSVTDATSPIVNSVELVDTGVILEVTPHVNASGLVTLDVIQEVSDAVATTTSDIDSPTIQQRRIESSIAVQSGDSIALGGLIRDRREQSESGVPLLGDIPLFGNLFKTTSEIVRRTELLVLITPKVVRDQGEARAVTEELRRRLSTLEPLDERLNSGVQTQ